MGHHSFEKVRTFSEWPYEKKVFVLSTRLTDIPADLIGKIEFIAASPNEILAKIHSKGFNNLYIDGGIVAQQFLATDLIDELIVTRIPIILGSGIPLFGELAKPLKFMHNKTEVYDGALVKTHYTRAS